MNIRLIKVADATGPALDWLVAKVEGHQWRCPWMLEKEGFAAWHGYETAWGSPTPCYSTDWAEGGPIIEREGIYLWRPYGALGAWSAKLDDWPNERVVHADTGLIAAMRCFVVSKLGPEVEVPEELFA